MLDLFSSQIMGTSGSRAYAIRPYSFCYYTGAGDCTPIKNSCLCSPSATIFIQTGILFITLKHQRRIRPTKTKAI